MDFGEMDSETRLGKIWSIRFDNGTERLGYLSRPAAEVLQVANDRREGDAGDVL